ncbi:hypothetical protein CAUPRSCDRAFT_2910, partial [Caulochytrium protostelioides]
NYALATVGARVYLPLTSPTYSVPYRSSALQWWSAFTGARVIAGRPPSVALVPSVLPGQCWALSGRHGQLAVVLAIPAFPVAFTLSHISSHASLLGDEGLRAAPRGTFHLSSSVRQMLRHQLGQPVPIVLLRIQSNWGHEPWTCVYNLQVH